MSRVLIDEVTERVRQAGHRIAGKAATRELVRAVFARIALLAAIGDDVYVPELGIFKRTKRKGRWIRNPATGEDMWLDETRSIRLAPAKAQRARR